MEFIFEFDKKKSSANCIKHGISLEKAIGLWLSDAVELDARYSGKPRFFKIGLIDGKMYTCIFTKRGEKIRLISCRRSRENEEKNFKEKQKYKTDFS